LVEAGQFYMRLPSRCLTTASEGIGRVSLACGLALVLASTAAGQFGVPANFEISPSIQIEDIDETDAKPQLARMQAYIKGEKWDEAIEALRKLSEEHGDRVVQLDDRRYVNLRDFCHQKIASLPPDALAMYRARVDQVAGDVYRQGANDRDERKLQQVVEQWLCSSFGDDALLALGDIALEQGEYDRARAAWQQISPLMRGADGKQVWQVLHSVRRPEQWKVVLPQFQQKRDKIGWTVFPDTELDLASIRARLVLCSILERSAERAAKEWEWFSRLHPDAAGRLAGREGAYKDTLSALLKASADWPGALPQDEWYTFAGNFERDFVAPRRPPLSGLPAWELSLAELSPEAPPRVGPRGFRRRQPTIYTEKGLEFHPLLVDSPGNPDVKLVLLCNRQQVFAFNAETGRPAWAGARVPGQIYPGGEAPADSSFAEGATFGGARFTMSVSGDLLLARIGSPVTTRIAASFTDAEPSSVICLNLRKQGALEWKYPPDRERLEFDEGKWAVEGAPVCNGETVFVGLRRSTFRSEAHVAALDARTGRLLWRRKICSADTPGHGLLNEASHNLLTLQGDSLYYNTNLGAVAAISARDGAIRWVYRYERSRGGNRLSPPKNFMRDLNPCVYHHGLVMSAPADSSSIFAVDAETGQVAWTCRQLPEEDQPLHLLGVGHGNLIATGDSVWWIDAAEGKKLLERWPDATRNGESDCGRGLLAAGRILWPTQEEILVLDQKWDGRGSPILDRIQLTRPDTDNRVTGGNLVFARGTLLVAGPQRLFAFRSLLGARPLKGGMPTSE